MPFCVKCSFTRKGRRGISLSGSVGQLMSLERRKPDSFFLGRL